MGMARIKVLSASVSGPDLTVRAGTSLYNGTFLGPKLPINPGYSIIGEVDAIGKGVNKIHPGEKVGALTVVGGYSEYLYWRADRLIPVPESIDPIQAVPLILNYIVAYQTFHRVNKVQPGESILIIGASGGIGTALMELGRLENCRMYGLASTSKFDVLKQFGVIPLDYHSTNWIDTIKRSEPDGLDAIFDGMMTRDYVHTGLSLLKDHGRMASFGEPEGFGTLFDILKTSLLARIQGGHKKLTLYGTSKYTFLDRKPILDDWASLFKMLEAGSIHPVIFKVLPLLDAAQAHQLLESHQIFGNIVLVP